MSNEPWVVIVRETPVSFADSTLGNETFLFCATRVSLVRKTDSTTASALPSTPQNRSDLNLKFGITTSVVRDVQRSCKCCAVSERSTYTVA